MGAGYKASVPTYQILVTSCYHMLNFSGLPSDFKAADKIQYEMHGEGRGEGEREGGVNNNHDMAS